MFEAKNLKNDLRKFADFEKANLLQGFFKTARGEYGEGDIFLGITVPKTRMVARRFLDLDFSEIKKLLSSKIHEERLSALLILVGKFEKSDEKGREKVFNFYIKNTKRVNNWDLVDLSASRIVGEYLFDKDKSVLYKLVKSKSLWDRRISIISTLAFIKKGDLADTLKISELLLKDDEDLMHKAVGWMLREAGKKDVVVLEKFLRKYYKKMPRTMLRYSIEKFPEGKRQRYLKGLL